MIKLYTTLFGIFCLFQLQAQKATISAEFFDSEDRPVEFANVALFTQSDSTMVKVETTNEEGTFSIQNVEEGTYFIEATCVGFADFRKYDLAVSAGQNLNLGRLNLNISSIELETAVVTTSRAIVEIKPDRTVFNVQGTINSAGDDGLSLLRKAPGVLVDNNNNISVLSRSGVMIYVDGKRLPLNGDNLTNYLQNLPAEQIDRIDIITNPGARYEAEGNAGIIDIRLKKDKGLGMNGSLSSTYSKGRFGKGNVSATGNYRNKVLNSFGSLGYSAGNSFHDMNFLNYQNGLLLKERAYQESENENYNLRWGMDFFLDDKHTLGFLVGGNFGDGFTASNNRNAISKGLNTPVDSILISNNSADKSNQQGTYNINYAYNSGKKLLNVDLDYGRYRNDYSYIQPNQYFNAQEAVLLTENNTESVTPVEIDIYTFKVDWESEVAGGKLGLGTKLSKVKTDNTFLFYDVPDETRILNETRSNQFIYDERVYAGYVNYARPISEKWNFSAGVRLEKTDATGDLKAFLVELQEPAIDLDFTNLFPSLGLTYQHAPQHSFSLNYGRRINRPDYNVLNPFREQWSELSFSKGNPFLQPEIVNNAELGYTWKYRYNFKLSYSKTTDQITRLIAPDEEDPRAGFITYANLAEQSVYAFNAALPIDITDGWSAFLNLSGSHIDNQADYGNGAVVDVQTWSYNIYQQHTFKLPGNFTGEISGWFSGPGVWGGVFLYETNWSLNLGLQKKFFKDQMNVRLSAQDIFYESGWDGYSSFNGLEAEGGGRWDSRRVSLSLSMNLGNKNVKSRKRKTGIESEAGRVKTED